MCNSAFVNPVNHKQDSKRTNCNAYNVECVDGVYTITLCNFVVPTFSLVGDLFRETGVVHRIK